MLNLNHQRQCTTLIQKLVESIPKGAELSITMFQIKSSSFDIKENTKKQVKHSERHGSNRKATNGQSHIPPFQEISSKFVESFFLS